MPTSQVNVPAQLKAFPYVAPPLDTSRGGTDSSLDSLITALEQISANVPDDITDLIGPGSTPVPSIGQDEWQSVSIADLSWVERITSPLNSALQKIDKIVIALTKILKIIELFTSTFNSFSKLIISAIELAQNKLNEFALDTMGFGVSANVLVPPALLKLVGDVDSRNQLRGGFNGFLTRLESSIYNVQDPNRPQFTTNDYVGGLVIVIDSESLDVAWRGMQQLASMFDFMTLFGLNLAPPPPTNLGGFSGRFSYDDEEEEYEVQDDITRAEDSADESSAREWQFGVQIEWDQTYSASGFNIYRSRVPGGQAQLVEYIPTSLVDNKETGEPGLLSIVGDWILNIRAGEDVQLPERLEYVYEDPDFPGPVFVPAGLDSRLKYVDTNMQTKILNPEADAEDQIEIPIYVDDEGKEVPVSNYYYMIRACNASGQGEGPNSKELSVAIKACNDAFSIADLIQHPNGRFEFFSIGYGKINNWSSIKLTKMIPWFTEIVGILNDFLETLKGMATSASDSFSDFLDQIKEKVSLYTNILGAVSYLVERVKDLVLGPSAAYLNVPPEKGGMPVFLERVKNAQGGEDFSGSNGITIGVVLVYGASGSQIAQLALLKRAFDFIYSLFVGD